MSGESSKLVYSTEAAVPRKEKPGTSAPKASLPLAQQQVRVMLERKGRGGKAVSVVGGVQGSEKELELLLKHLKTKLGAGGAVKGGVLEVQGDHRDAICAVLRERGYRPKKSGG
jgi:translation initiation factor 1